MTVATQTAQVYSSAAYDRNPAVGNWSFANPACNERTKGFILNEVSRQAPGVSALGRKNNIGAWWWLVVVVVVVVAAAVVVVVVVVVMAVAVVVAVVVVAAAFAILVFLMGPL